MLEMKRWTVTRQKDFGFYGPSDSHRGKMHYDQKLARILGL